MKRFTKLFIAALFVCTLLVTSISLAGCVSSPNLVIGDTIYGKTLLSVTEKGLDETKITVPEGIEYIAPNAFLPSMLSLTEIKLPKSLQRIGTAAFSGCINLRKVKLPKKNKLTIIEESAFSGCLSIEKLTLSNLTEIGGNAFYNCGRLVLNLTSKEEPTSSFPFNGNAIIVPAAQLDNYKKFFTTSSIFADDKVVEDDYISLDGTTLDKYIGCQLEVTTPKSLTKIASNAFSTTTIEKVTLPSTVTELADSAFKSLPNLREITLSSSLKTIPSACFSGLSKLNKVTFPNDSKITTIGDEAFYRCSKLFALALPNTVDSIGTSAFAWCSSLTGSFTFPSLTSLGSSAFSACKKITEINVPKITRIADNTFSASGITKLTAGTLKTVGASAFAECDKLTGISSLSKVTNIGDSAFNGAVNLAGAIDLSSATTIGAYAFADCAKINGFTFSQSLLTVTHYTFRGCTGVSSITLPRSITQTGLNVFSGWTSSQTVNVPDNSLFRYASPWKGECSANIVYYPIT